MTDLNDGSPCPTLGCSGALAIKLDGVCECSAMRNPPCPACENSTLACDVCGFELENQ